MTRLVPAALATLVALLVAAPTPADVKTDTDFTNFPPLATAISRADTVILHEGLPHPVWEKDKLAVERKTKETMTHHGFPFYAETLDLKPADAKSLIAVFATPGAFAKWQGPKKCGGFHPDYLVEYHVGKDVYLMLVCFGCGEVKLFGPRSALHCDMGSAAEPLAKALKGYRKNRPDPDKK